MDDVGLWTAVLDKLPVLASGVAAFLGGGAGSAITAGLVKSWQDRRRDKRGALVLAEEFADFFDGFAAECGTIVWRNTKLPPYEIASGKSVTTLPSIMSLSEGPAWHALHSAVRQSVRAFKQNILLFNEHVDYRPYTGRYAAEAVRDFNISAAKLGIDAMRVSDLIRARYGIARPTELRKRTEGIRTQLEQQVQTLTQPESNT